MIKQIIPPLIGKVLSIISFAFPTWTSAKAIALFCKPRKGKIRPRDEKFLNTSHSSDTFQTKYGSIKYYVWNEDQSQTILLLHGWESNSARWRLLIEALSTSGYRIVSIDAPAHGASDSDTFDLFQYIYAIETAVQKFGVKSMIGHSAGGLAINFYLSRVNYPKLDHIVLLGSPSSLREIVENYYEIIKPSSRVKKLLEIHFEKMFDIKIDEISGSSMIKGNLIPTLIIHDNKDHSIQLESANENNRLFANSTLMITDGYGHGLQNKEVFNKIKNFLAE